MRTEIPYVYVLKEREISHERYEKIKARAIELYFTGVILTNGNCLYSKTTLKGIHAVFQLCSTPGCPFCTNTPPNIPRSGFQKELLAKDIISFDIFHGGVIA